MNTFRFFLGGKNPLSLSYLIQSHFLMACYWLFAGQSWPVDSLVQDWLLNKLLFPKFFGFQFPWCYLSIWLEGEQANAEDESHGIGVSRGAGCGGRPIIWTAFLGKIKNFSRESFVPAFGDPLASHHCCSATLVENSLLFPLFRGLWCAGGGGRCNAS